MVAAICPGEDNLRAHKQLLETLRDRPSLEASEVAIGEGVKLHQTSGDMATAV